jgi:pimeloyl-ACP methyl ester carboxylesterase
MHIHLIPGLGADHRIFCKLDTAGHTVQHLDWPVMPRGSTITDFARTFIDRVDQSVPHALVGMSMGGMVAQELALFTQPQRVVIISSWKGPHEMPPPLRLLRGRHPERVLTKAFLDRVMPMVRWQMGVEDPESVALLDALVRVHGIDQLKVQIHAALNWKGPRRPPARLVHIHGNKDLLMPLAFIKDAQVVEGGSHFMVHDSAAEVSALLHKALAGH